MTYEDAADFAKTISRKYGPTVIFREPTAKESYQAIASDPLVPLGATIVAYYDNGSEQKSLRPMPSPDGTKS